MVSQRDSNTNSFLFCISSCAVSQEQQQRFHAPFNSVISHTLAVCPPLLNCYDSAHIRLWAANERPAGVTCSITETELWLRGGFSSEGTWMSVFPPLLRKMASPAMRMLTKFHHLQSYNERMGSKWATKILYRHVSLSLFLSLSLPVFLFSLQPRDRPVSTSDAFVRWASRSTEIVNETLCLWAS